MSVVLGAGWQLVHMTDRVIELRKECPVYRRFVGRDGYVKLRAEPGMDRNALIDKARDLAKANDESLAERVSKQLLPRRLGGYQMKQRQMAPVFAVPGEEDTVYKP